MNANELRVGSIVYFGIVNEPIIITKIDPNSVNIEMAEPITLTEEWLLKLGFKKATTVDVGNRWFIGENPVTKDWMLVLTWLNSYDCPFYKNGHHEIRYVHQLQNLYFALTREELNYLK